MLRLIYSLVFVAVHKLRGYIATRLVASMIVDVSLLLLPLKTFPISWVFGQSKLHYRCPGVSLNQNCQAIDRCFLTLSTP